jgi:uncharacterized protein DUF3179
VFRADVDGRALTFDLAGLKGSNFVMRDLQTNSEWQQATGEAFTGPLRGKRLAKVPFLITTWGEWRARHPRTLALVPEPEHQSEYARMAQMMARFSFGRSSEPASLRKDPRLPAYEQIAGLETGGMQKAYPFSVLRKQSVVNDQVGTTPVLLVYVASIDTITAFSRDLRGHVLTFHAAKPGEAGIMDDQTHSRWTPYGECIEGKLNGGKLEPLIPLPSFWFSWAEFFPTTQIYSAGAG